MRIINNYSCWGSNTCPRPHKNQNIMKMKSKSKICPTAGNTTTLLGELIPVSIQALTLQLKLQQFFFVKNVVKIVAHI